jgi:hypothetical protein
MKAVGGIFFTLFPDKAATKDSKLFALAAWVGKENVRVELAQYPQGNTLCMIEGSLNSSSQKR